jgi:hypothetical protein
MGFESSPSKKWPAKEERKIMNAYQSKYQSKRRADEIAVYVFGRVEQWIEDYAKSNNLPANELAERVAGLLFSQTGRQILGAPNRVPTLRGNSAGFDQSMEQVALARGSHRGAQVDRFSEAGRARIVQAQKRRWAKHHEKKKKSSTRPHPLSTYWAKMTPEQRSKEMIRRRQVTEGKAVSRNIKKSPSPDARERKRARDREYYYAAKAKKEAAKGA